MAAYFFTAPAVRSGGPEIVAGATKMLTFVTFSTFGIDFPEKTTTRMLKQSLQQKLQQKMSPLQIQVVKLLELPTAQLEQRIKEEIEDNPILDVDSSKIEDENPSAEETPRSETTIEDYLQNETTPAYKLQTNNFSPDDKHEDIPFSENTSFHEYLKEQIGMQMIGEREQMIAEYIIGNIDEDGYLRRSVEEMVDDIAFSQNEEVTDAEVAEVLAVVQNLDPVGVGARDLHECLWLQAKRQSQDGHSNMIAFEIIDKCFDDFTHKHYDKIARRLHIERDELREAIDEIIRFNPKPGSAYSNSLSKIAQPISPDFIVEDENGKLVARLAGRKIPEFRINRTYTEMMEEYARNRKNQSREQVEAVMFVKQKLDSAKWFVDAVRQRNNTLQTVMNAILDYQRAYFSEGDESKLRPMIMKDIAELTQLDISTISRVSNSKYVQTTFGIFPLKHFFSEGVQTDTGEEVSTREVMSIIEKSVMDEDKDNPLTDENIVEILKKKSYTIARRTVAKYREKLGIPVARLRKQI